jgi:putative ABC transport system permease protein
MPEEQHVNNKRDRELNEELASHLRMAAQDKMDRGVPSEDAKAAASRELGNTGLIQEVTREMDGWRGLERLLQDVRYGLRVLRRNPSFTVVSVLTLALGIGASTAIFSVVYGVLLRPLPYYKASQLVQVWEKTAQGHSMNFADPNFEDMRAQNTTLQGMVEYGSLLQSVSGGAEPRRLTIGVASRDFFPVMAVQPYRGRTFLPEEQRLGAAPVALVSYGYWRDGLGSREDFGAIKLKTDDRLVTVIGVLPPGFRFPDDADLWIPRELFDVLPARSAHNWKVLGRLKEGVSLAQANTELSGIAGRIAQQNAGKLEMSSVAMLPLQKSLTGEVSSAMLILLGAVGFLLLVACANVMNLLLAQAAAREGELATRAALGASRGRLIRQFLVESLLLCLMGGLFGVVAARFGVQALLALAPSSIPRLNEVSVSTPVLLFALGLCCLVAIGLGTVTALRASSRNVQAALVEGNRRQAGSGSQRLGRTIIALQLGITMVLLIGAGLLGRSLLRVLSVDPGFRTENIVTVDLALSSANVGEAQTRRVQFIDALLTRLRALPGVTQAGSTNALPLDGDRLSNGTYAELSEQQLSQHDKEMMQRIAHPVGELKPEEMKEMIGFLQGLFSDPSRTGDADFAVVSDGYFETLGIQLRRGRLFQQSDGPDAPHAAVISETAAQQRWPNQDPIGHTIEFGNMDGDLRLLHIVGVVADVKDRSLEAAARPTVYVNCRQRPQGTSRLVAVIRTSAPPETIISSARKIVADLDPNVPPKIKTFQQVYASSLTPRRFNLTLIAIFALAALALATIGIYGVLAYSVARRTREIGVRMALGATSVNVLKLVLRQAASTAAVGVGVGIVAAFVMMRLMQSMLFGVSASDPFTFAAVASMLLLVALLAAYVPARRATKVDPMIALRYE